MNTKKTIALVMIVKNEERGIERAVASARPFVDQVWIYVDSESTDNTFEIAKRVSKNVEYFHFADDFSLARNFAHRNVKTDWILFLDGHEYLERCEKLDEYLNLDCDSLLCTVVMENGVEFKSVRIYKRGLQFEGSIHERVKCQNSVLCSGVVVKHNRLEGQTVSSIEDRNLQRNDQMPRLMGEQLKKNPRDLRALFHLSLFYQVSKNYRLGLKYQKLFLKWSKSHAERYFILYNRSLVLFERGKLFRAFWAINRAGWEEPERWETEKMKGLIYFAGRKYQKALPCLVNSFNSHKKDYLFKPLKRDDVGTWNLIGECFYNLGIFDKASTAFQLASEREEVKEKKEFFASRSKLMRDMLKS